MICQIERSNFRIGIHRSFFFLLQGKGEGNQTYSTRTESRNENNTLYRSCNFQIISSWKVWLEFLPICVWRVRVHQLGKFDRNFFIFVFDDSKYTKLDSFTGTASYFCLTSSGRGGKNFFDQKRKEKKRKTVTALKLFLVSIIKHICKANAKEDVRNLLELE